MPAARSFSLSTAHRMVDRVHYDTTHFRSAAIPPCPACFAITYILMLNIADLA